MYSTSYFCTYEFISLTPALPTCREANKNYKIINEVCLSLTPVRRNNKRCWRVSSQSYFRHSLLVEVALAERLQKCKLYFVCLSHVVVMVLRVLESKYPEDYSTVNKVGCQKILQRGSPVLWCIQALRFSAFNYSWRQLQLPV